MWFVVAAASTAAFVLSGCGSGGTGTTSVTTTTSTSSQSTVCSPIVDLNNLWQPDAESITLDAGLDHLRSLFQTGIQVEQTTIQPYLSSMYSMDEGTSAWASSLIHSVAIEEMLHMTAAANILNAIGGHPCINSTETVPAYPQYVSYLNLTADVAPFTPATIKLFRRIEEPAWGDDTPKHTVATFYTTAGKLLEDLVNEYGEAAVFTGDPGLQVNFTSSRGQAQPVYSHADAQEVLSGIIHQGEGSVANITDTSPFSGDQELAHYYRFNEIVEGRFYAKGDTPSSPPSGDDMGNNWTAVHDFLPSPKAEDYRAYPDIYKKMMQFNACYSDMLARLHSAMNGSPDDYSGSLSKMHVLGPLAKDLIQTPSPLDPSKGVGPPWELINLTASEYQCPVSVWL